MKKFADQLGFPEAPVRLPDGSFLFVEMAPDRGWVIHIGADGQSRNVIAKTGRPNGLALGRGGVVWVAETAQRSLLRMGLDGKYEAVANSFEGKPFMFLNDVAVGPKGDVFFTDSGIEVDEFAPAGQLHPDWRNLRYDGAVYRFDPATRAVECVDRGIQFTNGIAFGPDGHLYVAETLSGDILRYAASAGRVAGKREVFGNAIEHFNLADLKGPDGMKFGADGCLYIAVFGQGDVTVLGRDGRVARRIRVEGAMPTNLAFGGAGEKKIYVTEVVTGSVQVCDVGTDGLPLHS
jgi:gluconolactonase